MIDIFDNNALIRCIEMLLEEFLELEDDPEKSEAGPKSKGNPLHLAVNGSRFRMIKENLGGTELLLYGRNCNENNVYSGRKVLVRMGYGKKKWGLWGMVTGFKKVPFSETAGKKYVRTSEPEKIRDETLIAEIDFVITDDKEFSL